jgi:outer membrane lipoprotein-sorting protein
VLSAAPEVIRAEQLPLDKVIAKIREVYAGQCCFRATFDQVTVNVAMDMKDRFQGRMFVRKPSTVMLQVLSPESQYVLVEGRSYSVYFPAEGNTAKGETPPELNLERFFGFFANIGEMDQNFHVSYATRPHDEGDRMLRLDLLDKKNPTGTYSIQLGVDMDTFILKRAVVYDALGNYNRFDLFNTELLSSLPDAVFRIPDASGEAP